MQRLGGIRPNPQASNNSVSKKSDQTRKFLNESASSDITTDLREFWMTQKYTIPQMFQLARIILSVPATSASAERIFSIVGILLSARRSNLHPLRVEKAMFVRENYREN